MWVIYLAVILAVIALYVMFLIFVVPLAGLAVGILYCIGLPGAYIVGLGQVLAVRPPGLPGPKRWPSTAPDDPAVLGYFYGPAVADVEHGLRAAIDQCKVLWRLGGDTIRAAFDTDDMVLITAPLGIAAAVGLFAGSVFGAVAAAGCALAHLFVVGVSTAGVRAGGFALRGLDSGLLWVKNIRMVCPRCYERVHYPAYDCPGDRCTRRHGDVRPGKYGIVRRRCRCGTRMPTLLMFGSSRMAAHCPYKGCGESLEHRPGEAPEIVLPLFGATGAGKTRLLYGIVTQLRTWTDEGRLNAEFADTFTTRELNVAESILRSGRATAKTSPALPRGQIIRMVTKNGTRILHLFDAAGERFYRTERTQELSYFDKARTFLLIIDPLSVEGFWDRLPTARKAELTEARSVAPSPDLAYQQTHQEMEAMGVRLKRARLAVVFSRADLIDASGGDVAEWARAELGLGNLVRSARQNFKDVGFFRTAAVMDSGGGMHQSVAALMRWVLAGNDVRMPGGGRD